MKPAVAIALLLSFGSAPFQCAHGTSNRRREDTPSEAMWHLADRFHTEGMEDARHITLQQIITQYPSSREAEQARLVLDGHELTPTDAHPSPTASHAANATDASTAATASSGASD